MRRASRFTGLPFQQQPTVLETVSSLPGSFRLNRRSFDSVSVSRHPQRVNSALRGSVPVYRELFGCCDIKSLIQSAAVSLLVESGQTSGEDVPLLL